MTKRNQISIDQKVWLCDRKQSHKESHDVLSREFDRHFKVDLKLTKSTISGILLQADKWRVAYESEASSSKKVKVAKEPQLEQVMVTWLNTITANSGKVSDQLLTDKAKEVATEMGITGLAFSHGWLAGFKSRYNVRSYKLHGEAKAADVDGVELARTDLPALIDQYALEDVYNYDETGLNWRQPPDRTLATSKSAGGKKKKERITIGLACNATGTDKLKPVIVGKSARPRAWKKWDPKTMCHYFSNTTAWVTTTIFVQWINAINAHFRSLRKKILLLVDNAPVHGGFAMQRFGSFQGCALSNITCIFLPKNTTSVIQPLDQGIIQSFKIRFRRFLAEWILQEYDRILKVGGPNSGQAMSKVNADMMQCMLWVEAAWNQTTPECIRRCWRKAGIITLRPGPFDAQTPRQLPAAPAAVVDTRDETEELQNTLTALRNRLPEDQQDGIMTASEFVNLAGEGEVMEPLSVQDLVRMATGTDEVDEETDGDDDEEVEEEAPIVTASMAQTHLYEAIRYLSGVCSTMCRQWRT
jgi:hypothetical protein